MTSVRIFFLLGSLLGGVGVGLGAFGAHGLQRVLSADDISTFEIGVRYQMYHALALLAVAWAASRWESGAVLASGWLFVAGIVLFSGSLYLLALTASRWLVWITPVGGLAFLLGWAALAWSAFRG